MAKKKAAAKKSPGKGLRAATVTDGAAQVDLLSLALILQEHALGHCEMTATQVNVALSLLKIFGAPQVACAHEDGIVAHEDVLAELT